MTKKPRRRRAPTRRTVNTLGLQYLRDRIHEVLQPVITGAFEAALGVRHLYEKDPATGQWARVTDPDAMAARLNELHHDDPEHRIVLYAQDPDARLLEGLLTVVLGDPFDPVREPSLVETIVVDAKTGARTVRVTDDCLAELRRLRTRPGGPAAVTRGVH